MFLFFLELEKTTRSIENNAHVYMLLASFITLLLVKSGVQFQEKFDLNSEQKVILKLLLNYVKMLISLPVLGFSLLESTSALSIER